MAVASTNKNTTDLTEGNIAKKLLIFAAPVLVGQLFQTLYNSVDSIVVGQFVGTTALSAVTATSSLAMLIVGFFNGLATGATVLFARNFGAKDYKALHDSIHTSILFSILIGVAAIVLGIIFTPQLLGIIACPDDVYDEALIYLRIYFVGVLFIAMYNVGSAVLRSIGDSKDPFYYLVLSSCLNIVLDILFVAVLNWGVAGVAIATVLAQAVSVVLTFWKMMTLDDAYKLRFSDLSINGPILKEVLMLALPAGLQASITSISNIYIQRYINSFSSAAIAGIGSAMKIDQFVGMPCNALGLAMTTFISQNIGAGKNKRTFQGVRIALLFCVVYVCILGVPVYFNASTLMSIFGSDTEMIYYGVRMLETIMPVYIIMGFQMLFGGIVRGYGHSIASMVMSVMGMVVVRQIWLYITLNFVAHDITFIYMGYPIAWSATLILLAGYYFFKIKREFKVESEAAE